MTTTSSAAPAAKAGLNGWVEAILYNIAIALMTLAYAVAIRAGSHVVPFILYSMVIGAAGLVAVKGFGRDALAIALYPLSWVIGAAIIGMEAFFYVAVAYFPPADASLMVRTSIPLSLLLGVMFFGRRVSALGWLGGAMVLAAVLYLMVQVDLPGQIGGLIAVLACGIIINVRSFSMEAHPWNRAAATVPEKMRVTGIVVLVTAFGGFVLTGILVALVEHGVLAPTPLVPTPAQFVHLPTIGLAVLVGGAIYSALNYLGFSSVVKIGSENFIASAAFTPLATLIVQMAAEATGLIAFEPFDWRLLPTFVLAIVGVLVIVWAGRRAKRRLAVRA